MTISVTAATHPTPPRARVRRSLPARRHALAWAALACVTAAGAQVSPPQAPAATQPEAGQTITVTGSRVGTLRSSTETATPVDMIRREDITASGQLQLQNALSVAVPSFSVSKPSTAGALDFTSSPTLRGLGPGDLLLLVNGKRRHTTGALNLNNQIGRGDVGYDFNTIPPAAIGRIEVLRDGASAVYGADAVAGVINVILDKSTGGVGTVQVGATDRGDGETVDASVGFGARIGDGGVLRTTVRVNERKRSNRAEPDTRQQYFGTNPTTGAPTTISGNYGSGTGLTPSNGTLDPREASIDRDNHWLGDSPFRSGSLFVNGEVPFGDVTAYAFGGASTLTGRSQGFFRRPGDDRTVRALHPNGFRPYQRSEFENASLAVGARGTGLVGFDWDVSTLYGRSSLDDRIENSNNASLGAASPTAAYVGGVRFAQWTSNLDLTRELSLGARTAARFATGLELRREWFESVAGEPDSYRVGGSAILDGPNAGRPAPVGMQMLPGLTPGDVRDTRRSSAALYAELEQDLSRDWVLTGAARLERFSDFGNSSTYKVSTRYKVSQPLSLRGSYSTGFKAPHLAQSYTSTTTINFTSFVATTVRLLPVDDAAARSLGAQDLKPAKSQNASLGFVFSQGAFSATVDAYQIRIKDRLALSTQFASAALTAALAARGFPGIDAVQFMTNAIDTTTRGLDISGNWRVPMAAAGTLTATFAANYNETKLDRIAGTPAPLAALGISAPLFDLTQQVRVTESTPKDKFSLGLNWKRGDWSANLNTVRYGKVSTVASTSLTPARIAVLTPGYDVRLEPTAPPSANSQVVQTFGAKWITDLSGAVAIGKFTLTAGINNLFDVYPDRNLASTPGSVAAGTNGSDNAGIFPYPYISPFGYSGRGWFLRGEMKF
jgi:iron complex outermembrane receptor protein